MKKSEYKKLLESLNGVSYKKQSTVLRNFLDTMYNNLIEAEKKSLKTRKINKRKCKNCEVWIDKRSGNNWGTSEYHYCY